jgi:pimeloyl-ACP methyl ester carboxylesterase
MTIPAEPSDCAPTLIALPTGPASITDEGPRDAAHTFLLVHGLPGSVRDFRWLVPPLAAAARVVRLEMPGFGATPLATGPSPSVEARAAFVIAVADALDLARPVLVGHSMGGVVGTLAVTGAPDRFAGLALISSPGLRVHRGLRRFRPRPISRLLRLPLAARLLRGRLRRAFEATGFRHASDAEIVHTVHCVAAVDMAAHAERMRALSGPLLHGYCTDDPLIETDILDEAARVTGGTVLRFDQGGHNPQKYQAIPLAEALLAWADRLA